MKRVAAVMAASCVTAFATTTGGRLTVSATVVRACAITVTAPQDQKCTAGVTPQITLYPRATASQPTLRGDVMEVVF